VSTGRGSSAAAAADRVRAVLEAAEQSAAALRADAAREIEAQLERAETVTARLSERAEAIERALGTLADTVRDELSALKADLEELRAVGEGAAEAREAAEAAEPAPADEPAPAEPEAAPPAAAPREPEAVAEAELPAEPAHSPAQPPAPAADGHEGARVIALNMALGGSSREETARYLSENFELENPDALLDEVYARIGG
jgi:hypothetical protein